MLFRRGLLPYQNGSHADRAEGEFVIEYFHIVLRFAQRGGVEQRQVVFGRRYGKRGGAHFWTVYSPHNGRYTGIIASATD